MNDKDYIVMLYGDNYISALELLYDTTWYIYFWPDGEIKKLHRHVEGRKPITYTYLHEAPSNQHAILNSLHAEWKRHLKNPNYRIPLRQVPASWR